MPMKNQSSSPFPARPNVSAGRIGQPIDPSPIIADPPDPATLAKHEAQAVELLKAPPAAAPSDPMGRRKAAPWLLDDPPSAEAKPSIALTIIDPAGYEDPVSLRRHAKGSRLVTTDAELAAKLVTAGRAERCPSTVRVQFVGGTLIGDRAYGHGEVADVDAVKAGPAIECGVARVLSPGHAGYPVDRLPVPPWYSVGHVAHPDTTDGPPVSIKPTRSGLCYQYVVAHGQVGRVVQVAEKHAIQCYQKRAATISGEPEKVFSARGMRYLKALDDDRNLYGPPIPY